MGRARHRVGDKHVLGLVKAFLRAGVSPRTASPGTPRWAHPRAASWRRCWPNIALFLDDHFAEARQRDMATRTQRATRRNRGGATYRLVRYADDFVVMVAGTEARAEGLRDEVAAVVSTMGLRLSGKRR
jgi:RNA-directed DNA polymerase